MNSKYPWIEQKLEEVTQGEFLERLPHALLIDSYPYCGADELASRLTQTIVGMEGDPREIPHPDVLWFKPKDPKLKKDRSEPQAADTQQIEPQHLTLEIDDFRDHAVPFVHLTASVASRKVAVLESIEQASIGACNMLLKSIEEPPNNVHWILTTTTYDNLLPTIRSRCTRIHLPPPPDEVMIAWLLENDVPNGKIDDLMIEYGGAPFATMNAIESKEESLRKYLTDTWYEATVDLGIATSFKNQDFNELVARWMRIAARVITARRGAECFRFWDELISTRRAIREQTNLNPQVQIERLLIEWFRMKQKMLKRRAGAKN